MKKIVYLFLGAVVLNVSLWANSQNEQTVSSDAAAAAADIKHLNEAVRQNKQDASKKKSEAELEAKEEKEAKEEDVRNMLNLYIFSLKEMKNKIPTKYLFTDVKIATMGETYYYVNSEELKRAISHLRKQKELRDEISAFLGFVKSQKGIKSDYLLNKEFTSIQTKVNQWQKNSQEINDAYEFKSTGKRVELKEGLVFDRITAKREGDFIELSIK